MKNVIDFLRCISVNAHSSVRIAAEGTVLYVDPFSLSHAPQDADVVFLTHSHFDHFSPQDVKKVCRPDTCFVLPAQMEEAAGQATAGHSVLTVRPNEAGTVCGVSFETVPAYNPDKPFHPKENGWVGYVLKLDGLRIYVAGDTDATDMAAAVRCDLALLPIGGKYTMDAEEAAALVNRMRPQAVIPIHYGSVAGSLADFDRFAAAVDPSILVHRVI